MIESLLFFALGFLSAALLAMLALPALAHRARRLSEARARLHAPLSQTEAIAERDQLRARHAVEQHRLEKRLDEVGDAAARTKAELGRRELAIVDFEDRQRGHLRLIDRQGQDLEGGQRRARALEAELSTGQLALNGLSWDHERLSAALAALRDDHIALETHLDQSRTDVAGLQTRLSGVEIKLDMSEAERARLGKSLADSGVRAAALAQSLDEAGKSGDTLNRALERTQFELATARQRVGQLEAGLAASEGSREGARREVTELVAQLREREKALNLAQIAAKRLHSNMEAANAREEAAAIHAQALATNLAKLDGALGVARTERAALRRDNERLKALALDKGAASPRAARRSEGDKTLRKAIETLGAEVLTLRRSERPPEPDPTRERADGARALTDI